MKNEKIEKLKGTQRGLYPLKLKNPPPGFPEGYPSFEVITVNGITEVIEHRQMEPVFYINGDPKVLAEFGVSRANKAHQPTAKSGG